MTITGKKKESDEDAGNHDPNNKRQKVSSSSPFQEEEKTGCSDGVLQQQPQKTINDYQHFSFQASATSSAQQVDVVSSTTSDKIMSGPAFFEQYISQRKPCVLDSLPLLVDEEAAKPKQQQQTIQITKDLLEQVAGDQTIQVERRAHAGENFGQNRTASRQIHLTISEFLRRMSTPRSSSSGSSINDDDGGGELLYWSTQEDTDDTFNVPCRQLVDRQLIPARLALAGNLILSSSNLWMGKTVDNNKKGASSGLHHDYHDNFYLLLRGRKRFRLFSPDCAPHLATYGTIDRIHPNGRISYVGNETRADGVPLESLPGIFTNGNANGNDSEDEDEEELVLGKGFDYVSDGSDGGDFDEDNQKDDFEEMMGQEDASDSSIGGNNNSVKKNNTIMDDEDSKKDEHPDSFSRINPCRTDRDALEKDFPSFASCVQVTVELKAGQMLFLPAGWFHEVTSYSNTSQTSSSSKEEDPLADCHMALNYWYHPPDVLNNYDNPYQDDFWKNEGQQRLGKS